MFAPVFHLLPISFCLSFYLFAPAFCPVFLLFVLLCSGCFSLFSLLICVCCFLFPFGLRAKREGAKVLLLASSLRLLWDCLVVQILVTLSKNSVAVALARSNSFGW